MVKDLGSRPVRSTGTPFAGSGIQETHVNPILSALQLAQLGLASQHWKKASFRPGGGGAHL